MGNGSKISIDYVIYNHGCTKLMHEGANIIICTYTCIYTNFQTSKNKYPRETTR